MMEIGGPEEFPDRATTLRPNRTTERRAAAREHRAGPTASPVSEGPRGAGGVELTWQGDDERLAPYLIEQDKELSTARTIASAPRLRHPPRLLARARHRYRQRFFELGEREPPVQDDNHVLPLRS